MVKKVDMVSSTFRKITIVSAGERDPESDKVSGAVRYKDA